MKVVKSFLIQWGAVSAPAVLVIVLHKRFVSDIAAEKVQGTAYGKVDAAAAEGIQT